MFGLFKKEDAIKFDVSRMYGGLVEQGRSSVFYETLCVPDSTDGRFDLIALHVFLLMNRIQQENDKTAQKAVQALFDCFFKDMDRSLREQGVGDLGVPRHIKMMMRAFKGRATSYHEALKTKDSAVMADAVQRNIYAGQECKQADKVASYIFSVVDHLQAQPIKKIYAGHINFPEVRS